MQISTSLLPCAGLITADVDIAVVIDVLRATSVMATALQAGASDIVTCREVTEAVTLAERSLPRSLLCGERGCKPIEGFDLGNSPADYVATRVAGKTLVLTTTNGTRAIEAAAGAERMITASFLNLSAVVEALRGSQSVHLVCAGTEGEITAEDVLLAGAILCACETRHAGSWRNDESTLAAELWRSWFSDVSDSDFEGRRLPAPAELSRRLRETRGGRNLVRLGYEKDVERCAAIDTVTAVPERIGVSPTTFSMQAI